LSYTSYESRKKRISFGKTAFLDTL
jgi:hypothetical protein